MASESPADALVRTRALPDAGQEVAAVDLGSNSFHLVIARVEDGGFAILDRMREPVRLAAGLDADERLTEEAQQIALECLRRFGQRLAHVRPDHVRALGTHALRRARNARSFLAKAHRALGHAIEILPGREEARLIYLGVSHGLPDAPGRQLVIDIGGGSTECILGERLETLQADSLSMGCVAWSLRYFPGGELSRDHFRKAEIAAGLELQTIERSYRTLGWERAVGASGTITGTEAALQQSGWCRSGIDAEGLKKLRRALIECGRASRIALPGVSADRAPVLAGGVAILRALFDSFAIEQMQVAPTSMREGVLHDLVGRFRHVDVRDHTVRRLAERWSVDREHAARVERTALLLLRQTAESWGLADERWRQLLVWAARLHEVGLAIAYAGHHKHGGYLLANCDMPGFSQDEQDFLAALVLGHRRKLARETFERLPDEDLAGALRLCVLLRLAVLLHRSRSPQPLPAIALRAAGNALELALPADWLEGHALTRADLEEEQNPLKSAGFKLALAPA